MRELRLIVDRVIKANPDETPFIQQSLILDELGLLNRLVEDLPPVYREALNEPYRRAVLAQRRAGRRARREASPFGDKGRPYRRVIRRTITREKWDMVPVEVWPNGRTYLKKVVTPGSVVEFHATKGRRVYRLQS